MEHQDEYKILQFGKELSEWPLHKLQHAQTLTQQLIDKYNQYRNSLGDETETILTDDGHTALFKARITTPPPIVEWSLLFGDIIHNYRSALDGLVWDLAHLEGRTPKENVRTRIYFPFAKSKTEWERFTKGPLASVPDYMKERLRRVQPYLFEPVEKSIGIILHNLDIQDKHRAQLNLNIHAADKTSFQLELEHANPDQQGEVFLDRGYKWLAPAEGIKDGDNVLEIESSRELKNIKLPKLPILLTIENEGEKSEIFHLLELIDAQTVGTFEIIMQGNPSNVSQQNVVKKNLDTGTWVGGTQDSFSTS